MPEKWTQKVMSKFINVYARKKTRLRMPAVRNKRCIYFWKLDGASDLFILNNCGAAVYKRFTYLFLYSR